MTADSALEWPIDFQDNEMVCTAPIKIRDARYRQGFRIETCYTQLPHAFTLQEALININMHIDEAVHDLEVSEDGVTWKSDEAIRGAMTSVSGGITAKELYEYIKDYERRNHMYRERFIYPGRYA